VPIRRCVNCGLVSSAGIHHTSWVSCPECDAVLPATRVDVNAWLAQRIMAEMRGRGRPDRQTVAGTERATTDGAARPESRGHERG